MDTAPNTPPPPEEIDDLRQATTLDEALAMLRTSPEPVCLVGPGGVVAVIADPSAFGRLVADAEDAQDLRAADEARTETPRPWADVRKTL